MISFSCRDSCKHLRRIDQVFEGYLEFKKVFVMPAEWLRQFHGASIEVEVDLHGTLHSIRGTGSYQADDPDLGPVLKIQVTDPLGDFEFLVAEATWSGTFEPSELPGCDFRVSFASRGVA